MTVKWEAILFRGYVLFLLSHSLSYLKRRVDRVVPYQGSSYDVFLPPSGEVIGSVHGRDTPFSAFGSTLGKRWFTSWY